MSTINDPLTGEGQYELSRFILHTITLSDFNFNNQKVMVEAKTKNSPHRILERETKKSKWGKWAWAWK